MSPFAGPSFSIAIQSDVSTVYPWETAKLECSLSVSGSSPKTGTTANAHSDISFFYFLEFFGHIRAHVHTKFLCHDEMILVASGCFISRLVEPFTLDAKQTFNNLFHSSLLHLVYPNLSHPFTFIAVLFKHLSSVLPLFPLVIPYSK